MTVVVSETIIAIDLLAGDIKVVRRTTDQPVRASKDSDPRTATIS
jgi:hypothetical protein